ncbi:MAG: DUF4338 domain-containing protein [Planctomycetota bacterium]|nr:DUF4338 domain-containing protein [Planctomycetota bacterium]
MRSRIAVLSALSIRQLVKIAKHCAINFKGKKKHDLLASVVSARKFSISSILDTLVGKELQQIAQHLDLPSSGNKDELIAAISGDKRRIIRARILKSLRRQGFRFCGGRLVFPDATDKDRLRKLHAEAVAHKRDIAHGTLGRKESNLLEWIANGDEVVPQSISPALIEVLPGSREELLFRYACMHWSIPVSSGYGRRLRYVVMDSANNKLIGVIGLGDPVFALAPRDNWIGWTSQQRRDGLNHVLDAFVLGAVPPYTHLLCGKLVAMLAASREVTSRFQQKYGGKESLISQAERSGEVALITTTSALGRSSLYNRLTFRTEPMFIPVGFTRGSGEFQFLNGLYDEMSAFATQRLTPTAKSELWGTGFRNRREVVRKCIHAAGLHQDLLYHGVQREVYLVPTASNSAEFLRGDDLTLRFYDRPAVDIFAWFRERWLLSRAVRDPSFATFDRASYALWPAGCQSE